MGQAQTTCAPPIGALPHVPVQSPLQPGQPGAPSSWYGLVGKIGGSTSVKIRTESVLSHTGHADIVPHVNCAGRRQSSAHAYMLLRVPFGSVVLVHVTSSEPVIKRSAIVAFRVQPSVTCNTHQTSHYGAYMGDGLCLKGFFAVDNHCTTPLLAWSVSHVHPTLTGKVVRAYTSMHLEKDDHMWTGTVHDTYARGP